MHREPDTKISVCSSTVNEGQYEAIHHLYGPALVLAGPGAGKTFVIIQRLKYMILDCHIDPSSILVITFTKSAADEMKQRFERETENQNFPVTFGTFHAIYFSILKKSCGYSIKNLINEKQKRIILKSICDLYFENECDSTILEKLLSEISKAKNTVENVKQYNPEAVSKDIFYKIYKDYNETLKNEKLLDFDDMLIDCKLLLENNPHILKQYQSLYRFILIDEFQDINPVQYKIIRMLCEPDNNLFIVGDDDQSIYGFRGSCPSIMLNFPNEFPNCKKILLAINYRCSKDIVAKSLSFIENNHERYIKSVTANKQNQRKISLKSFDNKSSETSFIVRIIKTALRNNPNEKIAVIYRTNSNSKQLTQALSYEKIDFIVKEKTTSYFSHPIAQDILAMLAFAHGDKRRNTFIRFMNKPVRYIPRKILSKEFVNLNELLEISELKPYLKNNIARLSKDICLLQELDILHSIKYILYNMGYEKYILKEYRENNNIEEAREILNLIKNIPPRIVNYSEYMEYIEEYNDMLSLTTLPKENRETNVTRENIENIQNIENKNTSNNPVTIITMHSSKGLEYDTVIIPELNEGYVPSSKARDKDAIEEERRIFYVAMTRAKDNLYLTHIKNSNSKPPSRFLSEIKDLKEI